MSLVSNLLPSDEPVVPMDDNAAIASAAENPYLMMAVPQVQAAFDMMYESVKYLAEGKRASLKQIDKWLEKWTEKLEFIKTKFQELLKNLNSAANGTLNISLTLDVAKEAWEMIQAFPILRRYLGEANYWLLYDTLGILSSQGASAAADMSAAAKATIKAAIKGLLAMTDGLMSLESYLAYITQFWGALYLKSIPLPLLDSIVPNVTCTYFYKPELFNAEGNNPAPRASGFIAVPIPIPNPDYVINHSLADLQFDYNDSSTWYDPDTQMAKFLNVAAFHDALDYWGSAYTNETIPAITSTVPGTAIYKRRPYKRDGVNEEAHPLQIGRTFAQLDTDRTVVAYGGTNKEAQDDNGANLILFQELYANAQFAQALKDWDLTWENARANILQLVKDAVGRAPVLDAAGQVMMNEQGPVLGPFTSMRQLRPNSGDAREDAYRRFLNGLFTVTPGPGRDYELIDEVYVVLDGVVRATTTLVDAYLAATTQVTAPDGIPYSKYRMSKCAELSTILAKAALAMRKTATPSSKLASTVEAIPLFGRTWGYADGSVNYDAGLTMFMKVLSVDEIPSQPSNGEAPANAQRFELPQDTYWRTDDPLVTWVTTPTWSADDPVAGWDTYVASLVYPTVRHLMPQAFFKREDGQVLRYTEGLQSQGVIGTIDKGALSNPYAWESFETFTSQEEGYPTCGFFISEDIEEKPITVIGALVAMAGEKSEVDKALEEEIADEVGYSILKGRRPLAACFGVYGNLMGMCGWCFKAMPAADIPNAPSKGETFTSKYARIPGSSLWYEIKHPDRIVFRHSTFYSAATGMPYTIYHEAMAWEIYQRGSESYTFYVFPTESISVQEIKDNSLGTLRSVDAVGPDGRKWHYVVVGNVVPKCPKYVAADKWSIIDILHELYLLAWNISPFCGDNGDRLAKLEGVLKEFGVTRPQFVSQLPDGNDVAAEFQVKIFDDYAERISALVDSIYKLREDILDATEFW